MTPKEYKQMMDYLTRSGVRKQIKFASDIARPDPKPQVQQIDAINAFMRRNPINKADGGRIGFKKIGVVRRVREGRVGGKYEGLFGVRAKDKTIYYRPGRQDEMGIEDDIIEVIEDTVTKKASGGVARMLGE